MCLSNYWVKLWNSLECELKSCRNIQVFKALYQENCILNYILN